MLLSESMPLQLDSLRFLVLFDKLIAVLSFVGRSLGTLWIPLDRDSSHPHSWVFKLPVDLRIIEFTPVIRIHFGSPSMK